MKIVHNATSYDTRTIRALVTAVYLQEHARRGVLRTWHQLAVTVVHCRGQAYTGRASLNGLRMTLRIPRDIVNTPQFVALIRHELWHNYGIRHRDYPPSIMHCVVTEQDKIASDTVMAKHGGVIGDELLHPIRVMYPVHKTKAAKPTTDDKRRAKLTSVDERIKRWKSKELRARNAIKKLTATKKRLERKLTSGLEPLEDVKIAAGQAAGREAPSKPKSRQ